MGVTALTGEPPQPSGPRPRLVYMPALTLAGLFDRHEQGSDERTRQGISEQWRRFGVQLAECFASQRGPAVFGLMCETGSDRELDYACVVETAPGAPLPAEWRTIALPTARYAVFAHGGNVSQVATLEHWIDREWLPSAPQARAHGFAGGVAFLERYGPRFDRYAGLGDIEVWVPIVG